MPMVNYFIYLSSISSILKRARTVLGDCPGSNHNFCCEGANAMANSKGSIQANSDQEIWRKVEGFDGYEVSSQGRVRSWNNNRHRLPIPHLLKLGSATSKIPYVTVSLQKNKKAFPQLVHRLVLIAFKGKCPSGMQSCHNNGDFTNNHVENLRWDTPKNNNMDKIRHGTWQGGSKNGNSKLTEEQVSVILKSKGQISAAILALRFCVTKGMIYFIWRKRNWVHVS